MNEKLKMELISETKIEDIGESYRQVAEITGVEIFVKLSDLARGDELYFPKPENVIAPARNRKIKKEFQSGNYTLDDLAHRYNLTHKQVGNVLKGEPPPRQLDIFDWLKE